MSSPLYDKMADAIRRIPSKVWAEDTADDPILQQLDRAFLTSEVFVSTNVTEYFFAGTDQEQWLLDRHFPNLAPPFNSFWIETKAPTHISSEFYGIQSWENSNTDWYQRPQRWGAWFLNVSLDTQSARDYLQEQFPDVKEEYHSKYWLYSITLFRLDGGDDSNSLHPMWGFALLVDKGTNQPVRNLRSTSFEPFLFRSDPMTKTRADLVMLERELGTAPLLSLKDPMGNDVPQTIFQIWEHEALLLLKPLLLSISFMHCKNVERVTYPSSPKQNKRRVARNQPPFNKFHTLEITPMRRIIDQAVAEYRGNKRTAIEMALHRVRGHFKTYTEDKPLMGHAVGTWFWAASVRGSARKGTVKKEYQVMP